MTEPLRLLSLEDNPADAELIQFELQDAGLVFTAKVVMTEEDFVRELQEFSPDLILSDYDLPKYNGALALAEAKKRRPDTPFILVTGAVGEDRAIEILTQGAKDYVLKSRLQQRLAPAVKRALAEAEELRARKKAEAELREAHRTLEERVKIRTAELETEATERKRAEEALRESEERFRTIFEETHLGIVIASPSFAFEKANPAFCRMMGHSEEELRSMTFADITHPDYLEQDRENVKKVGRGELPVYQTEKRYISKSGKVLWGNLIVSGIRDKRGALRHYLSTVIDVTERKSAEAEKANLQAQLLQSQKMESVGRLAGGVAHDFNNMLGVILGHTELALEQIDPTQPLYSDLRAIRNAAERSSDLTRQLLAFARKQTVSPKVLDLNKTVAGMLVMLRRLIGEDIHLVWTPGVKLWQVKIDPSQIDQVLANLCVNARDAIAGVGKVTIETTNIAFDQVYCDDHEGFVPGEYVLLAVSDNGCGMDKEILNKLFEPFFTTKEMSAGTGLGLATVYGIVRQNNGFINVYSEPGQGTTFRIYLARFAGKSEKIQAEGAAGPAMRGQETILLAEDEPDMLEMTATVLKMQGYAVLAACTPGEAIRLAREHAGEIHLLITDVVMPEMNGRDLAKNLLSLYPDLKRLFMSGYTADVIAHHGVLDEGVHFIQKPFSRKDLAAKVREALDQK